MALCGKCGGELVQDSQFCKKCDTTAADNIAASEAVGTGNTAEWNIDIDNAAGDTSYTHGNSAETPPPHTPPPHMPPLTLAAVRTETKYLIISIMVSGLCCFGFFFMSLFVTTEHERDTEMTAFKYVQAGRAMPEKIANIRQEAESIQDEAELRQKMAEHYREEAERIQGEVERKLDEAQRMREEAKRMQDEDERMRIQGETKRIQEDAEIMQEDAERMREEAKRMREDYGDGYSKTQSDASNREIEAVKSDFTIQICLVSLLAVIATLNGVHIIKSVVSDKSITEKGGSVLRLGIYCTIVFGFIMFMVPVLGQWSNISGVSSGTVMCAVASVANIILGAGMKKAARGGYALLLR